MKNNNNKKHSFQCRRTRVPPVPPLDSCAMVILMACFMKVRRPAKINKISTNCILFADGLFLLSYTGLWRSTKLILTVTNIDQAKQRKVSDKKVALSTIKPNQTDKRNQFFNDLKNKSKWHTIGTVQKILRNRQNQHPTHDQLLSWLGTSTSIKSGGVRDDSIMGQNLPF